MLYSQSAIQFNAKVSSTSLGLASYYSQQLIGGLVTIAQTNPIQQNVILRVTDAHANTCFYSDRGQIGVSLQTFTLNFNAVVNVDGVVLLPGDQKDFILNAIQNKVTVIPNQVLAGVTTVQGTCLDFRDYSIYGESYCNKTILTVPITDKSKMGVPINQIILSKASTSETPNPQLSFCSVGILSKCDCSTSSFDPTQFTNSQTDLVSTKQITIYLCGDTVPISSFTINTNMKDTVSNVCGNADGRTLCGGRTYTANNVNINSQLSYKGWQITAADSSKYVYTFTDPSQANTETYTITFSVKLNNYEIVKYTQTLTIQVLKATCQNTIDGLNMLTTSVCCSQGTFQNTFSANPAAGCDKIVTLSNAASNLVSTQSSSNYWYAKFSSTTTVKTALLINAYGTIGESSLISNYILSLGESSNIKSNTVCLSSSQMTDGGWWTCSGQGLYFAIFSTTTKVNFVEVMLYAQSSIQQNALSWISNSVNLVTTSITNLIPTLMPTDSLSKCVSMTSTTSSSVYSYNILFQAKIVVKGVVLLPGDNPSWTQNQNSVTVLVQIKDQSSSQQCGALIADFNQYSEVTCNTAGNNYLGNQISIQKAITGSQLLQFCSVGVLSNCDCSVSSFDPSIFTTQPTDLLSTPLITYSCGDSLPITFTVNSKIKDTVSYVCGTADGLLYCGARSLKVTKQSDGSDITSQTSYNGWQISTDASGVRTYTLSSITPAVQSGAISFTWTLNSYTSVTYTKQFSFQLNGAYCQNSIGGLNLLTTEVCCQQSSFSSTTLTPISGCDQTLMLSNTISNLDSTGTIAVSNNWSVIFISSTTIQTALLIDTYGIIGVQNKFPEYVLTLGVNSSIQSNTVCQNKMTGGGWWTCSGSGTHFAIVSTTAVINFVEAMLFSQYAIQMNAQSAFFFDNPATFLTNAISNLIYTLDPTNSLSKCVASISTMNPIFTIGLKAVTTVVGVVVVPADNTVSPPNNNVSIYIKNKKAAQQLCATINYSTYSEVYCNKLGDQIIVQATTTSILQFCSIGVLSQCDCSQSSLDPNLINFSQNTYLSATTLNATALEVYQQITVVTQLFDTVSSVCGQADGLTLCGNRVVQVFDGATQQEITDWPYKDFMWTSQNGTLTLTPTTAATTVLTIKTSLQDFPLVTYTEQITAIIQPAILAEVIPAQRLSATTNQNAILQLPTTKFPSDFKTMVLFPTLTVSVSSGILSVFSSSSSDQGKTYTLSMQAVPNNFPNKISYFTVTVTFAAAPQPTSTASSNSKSNATATANTTSEASAENAATTSATSAIVLSSEGDQNNEAKSSQSQAVTAQDLESLYECATNSKGVEVCTNKKTGQICTFNEKAFKMTCDLNAAQKQIITYPTFSFTQVTNRGFFSIIFTEPMNFQSLMNKTNSTQARRLRSSISLLSSTQDINPNQYLFNQSFMNVKSVSGGSVNSTMLSQTWITQNISDTQIQIQVQFSNANYVSSDPSRPDSLSIQLLQPCLGAFISQKGYSMQNITSTIKRELPVQLQLTKTTIALASASGALESVGQGTLVGQISMNLVLSQALGMMWTFVNALQVILAMPLFAMALPGNVYLILQNLMTLASFDLFQSATILGWMFHFEQTELPGVGFLSMGSSTKRMIPYLGANFLYLITIPCIVLVWFVCYLLRNKARFFFRAQKKLGRILFWSSILRIIVQGTLDITISSLLSTEELKWGKIDDAFDSAFSIIWIPIMAVLPIFLFFFLRANYQKMDLISFKRKFGTLFEGHKSKHDADKDATILFMVWFIVRRWFMAVIVVPGRHWIIWGQLAGNVWLALIDACVKIQLNPFENRMGGIMEIINDTFVLVLTYLLFLFTDFTLTVENRDFYGWVFVGVLGVLITVNISFMLKTAVEQIITKIKHLVVKKHNDKVLQKKGQLAFQIEKPFKQKFFEALGVDDLVQDQSKLSEEALEDRAENYYDNLMKKDHPQKNFIEAKLQPVPKKFDFFGYNNYVEMLDRFELNDPSIWESKEAKQKMSELKILQMQSEQSILQSEQLWPITEEQESPLPNDMSFGSFNASDYDIYVLQGGVIHKDKETIDQFIRQKQVLREEKKQAYIDDDIENFVFGHDPFDRNKLFGQMENIQNKVLPAKVEVNDVSLQELEDEHREYVAAYKQELKERLEYQQQRINENKEMIERMKQ